MYLPTCVRPYLGLERMVCSAEPFGLPGITLRHALLFPIDADAPPSPSTTSQSDADTLLMLIKYLVRLEPSWILRAQGCSVACTSGQMLIGTRSSLLVFPVYRSECTRTSRCMAMPRGLACASPKANFWDM